MEKVKLSHFILLVMSILMAGCKNNYQGAGNENATSLKSDTVPYSVKFDFDNACEISTDLKKNGIITFDEETENIPGGIQQIAVKGDTIFVVDPAKNPGLYAYLKDGSQLFAYCDNGTGPEDIVSPMSLAVTDSEINVFDFSDKKLISFSKDGRFKQGINLSMDVKAAIKDSNGGIWMDFSNQKYGNEKLIWKKDEKSKPITVLTVPEHLKGMTTVPLMNMVQLTNGELRYIPSIEPYIYALSDGRAIMMYELDFMGKWPSIEKIATQYQGNDWAKKFINFPIHIKGVAESDRWLVVGANFNKKLYITVYDKIDHTSRSFVDSQQEYYNPLYVEESNLYMNRSDDSIEILKID